MAIEITQENYADTVEKSSELVLLDVWAPWCQPCKAVEPMLQELEAAFESKLKVAKLNADTEPDLAVSLGVRGVPTVRLFQGGRMIFESVGVPDRTKLSQAIGAALSGGAI